VDTQLKNLADAELIELFRSNNNSEAIGILFNRYYHLVYGVCMKYLKHPDNAKDACMQIFEKLFADLPKHDIQFFKAWLYRVAQNHCLMQLRSNKYITRSVDVFPEYSMEYKDTLHPALAKEKMLTMMEEAIAELNPEQKYCIELFYLEKKTYNEIMDITGYNFMQVKSFIQNGKRNLKIKLNESILDE
jgi:RNA polymerase sigma-70 factor (ECF subfamily)